MVKLNLGCGNNKVPGYINIDKEPSVNPDVLHDLEQTPYPFESDSVEEIVAVHVLEHLGKDTETFFNIMKEFYRILAPSGVMFIIVPHPRCDNFIGDPTHVRVISPNVMSLFSKELNNQWIEKKGANSPLGKYLDIDFEIEEVGFILNKRWEKKKDDGLITEEELKEASEMYNNVIEEIQMKVKAVKNRSFSGGWKSIFS